MLTLPLLPTLLLRVPLVLTSPLVPYNGQARKQWQQLYPGGNVSMRRTWTLSLGGALIFLAGYLVAHWMPADLFGVQLRQPKDARFSHGLVLKVRNEKEADFSATTKRYGLEVYYDENTDCLIYITETGSISVVRATK